QAHPLNPPLAPTGSTARQLGVEPPHPLDQLPIRLQPPEPMPKPSVLHRLVRRQRPPPPRGGKLPPIAIAVTPCPPTSRRKSRLRSRRISSPPCSASPNPSNSTDSP